MKLCEIVHLGRMEDYTVAELEGVRQKILDTAEREYPLEKGEYRLVVSGTGHYALFNGEQLVGWIKLSAADITGRSVLVVVNTYIIPERRGTRDVPLLLFAVRQHTSPAPLLVDGALFQDGLELLNALIRRGVVKATVVSTDTGDTRQYEPSVNLQPADAIVLERAPALWADMSIVEHIPHIQTLPLLEERGVWIKSFRFIKSQPAPR